MSTAPGLEVYFGDLWNEPISGSPVTPFLWPPSPGEACAEAPGGLKSMALCLAPPSRCRVLGCRLPLVPALQEKGSWPAAPLAPRIPIGSSRGQAQWAAQAAIVNHTACRCLPTWPALRLGQSLWWELLSCLNWASLRRRQAPLLTCLYSGCGFTLSRRTACFLVWLALQARSSPLFCRWRKRNAWVDWVPAQGCNKAKQRCQEKPPESQVTPLCSSLYWQLK